MIEALYIIISIYGNDPRVSSMLVIVMHSYTPEFDGFRQMTYLLSFTYGTSVVFSLYIVYQVQMRNMNNDIGFSDSTLKALFLPNPNLTMW